MPAYLPAYNDGFCGCPSAGCVVTFKYVDENRCEDDNFDAYIISTDGNGGETETFLSNVNMQSTPPGCCGTDEQGNPCPQTTISFPVNISQSFYNSCMQLKIELRFVSANEHGTEAVFSLTGPGGEFFSSTFFAGGIIEAFDVRELCNPAP